MCASMATPVVASTVSSTSWLVRGAEIEGGVVCIEGIVGREDVREGRSCGTRNGGGGLVEVLDGDDGARVGGFPGVAVVVVCMA